MHGRREDRQDGAWITAWITAEVIAEIIAEVWRTEGRVEVADETLERAAERRFKDETLVPRVTVHAAAGRAAVGIALGAGRGVCEEEDGLSLGHLVGVVHLDHVWRLVVLAVVERLHLHGSSAS